MLIDDYLESASRFAGQTQSQAAMEREIRRAQRFVLSPLCVQTVDDLAEREAAERTRDYVFAPAENTWIEWADSRAGASRSHRHGILLIGAEETKRRSLHVGDGLYVFDANIGGQRVAMGAPIVYDFPGDGSPLRLPIGRSAPLLRRLAPYTGDLDFDALGVWIIAALALINTPRIAHARNAELGKLNAARMKRSRPPILQYKQVSIHVDAGELGDAFAKQETDGRALHHVRAFLRLARGRVQLVRPHWRGNPMFGVIVHRYAVLRAEDEAGPWKGGPMPGPSFIEQLREKNGDCNNS